MKLVGKRPKLSPAQVEQARHWRAAGLTVVAIADRLGVSTSTLGRYRRGEVKTHALARDA